MKISSSLKVALLLILLAACNSVAPRVTPTELYTPIQPSPTGVAATLFAPLATPEPSPNAPTELSFSHLATAPVGDHPTSIAVGDFDNDGDDDLAVTNDGGGAGHTISIVANDYPTGFVVAATIRVGDEPIAIVSGDWDSDGDLDLAVANHISDDISILRNDGRGNFAEASRTTMPEKSYPFMMAMGDFDQDGDLDISVANFFETGALSILANNGVGGFSVAATIVVRGNPYSVTTGDFDGDRDLDLAVSGAASNLVTVLRNDDGFAINGQWPVGDEPWAIVSGDWDGDGDVDLAVANSGSNDISILHNDGAGKFTPTAPLPVGEEPYSLAAGDFDRDGDLDLAIANEDSHTASIALNDDGQGTFRVAGTLGSLNEPWAVAVGDFNSDGLPDLAFTNSESDNLLIFGNTLLTP